MIIKFNSFEITLREILFSIIIASFFLTLGIVINNIINNHFIEVEEKYTKALKIDSDVEMFKYALDTEVGNIIVYGKFKAIDTVKDRLLINSYLAYEKVTEEYTRHSRQVCNTDSKGNRHCHTEYYYSWDTIDNKQEYSKEIEFNGIIFNTSKYKGYPWTNLELTSETIKCDKSNIKDNYLYENDSWLSSVGDKRHYYRIVPVEFAGTTFGVAKDKGYFSENKNNKKINIYTENINSFVEKQKVNKTVINFVFWVTYLIFLAIGIYCFVYNENNWLEDKEIKRRTNKWM